MLILDSDHLSALASDRRASGPLLQRLGQSGRRIATTIISVEEQVRGWLSLLARSKSEAARVNTYAKFQRAVEDLGAGLIIPFDTAAADEFARLKAMKLGVGTIDLRIAAIVLSVKATLLTRNLRDFDRVPGLTVQDWIE